MTRLYPRSAPCPCNSGLKYERCCGVVAPTRPRCLTARTQLARFTSSSKGMPKMSIVNLISSFATTPLYFSTSGVP